MVLLIEIDGAYWWRQGAPDSRVRLVWWEDELPASLWLRNFNTQCYTQLSVSGDLVLLLELADFEGRCFAFPVVYLLHQAACCNSYVQIFV